MGNNQCCENAIAPLQRIKGFYCNFNATKQRTRAIFVADKQIYVFVQKNNMTNERYFDQFSALVGTPKVMAAVSECCKCSLMRNYA